MRIAGGEYRGRTLKAPKDGETTRPTQDRVREALFSMLMEVTPGARFLDLYAGTGAVGLEALSRGASVVVWVESDRRVARLAAANIAAIAGEDAVLNLAVAEVERWIKTSRGSRSFDIVFADPPYATGRADGLTSLAGLLLERGIVAPGGIFASELPVDAAVSEIPGWTIVRDRIYGKSRIVIRQRSLDESQNPVD